MYMCIYIYIYTRIYIYIYIGLTPASPYAGGYGRHAGRRPELLALLFRELVLAVLPAATPAGGCPQVQSSYSMLNCFYRNSKRWVERIKKPQHRIPKAKGTQLLALLFREWFWPSLLPVNPGLTRGIGNHRAAALQRPRRPGMEYE